MKTNLAGEPLYLEKALWQQRAPTASRLSLISCSRRPGYGKFSLLNYIHLHRVRERFGMSSWDPAWHSSIPAKRDMKKPNRNLCEKQYSAGDFHTVQVRYVKSCVSLIYIDHFACLYRLL